MEHEGLDGRIVAEYNMDNKESKVEQERQKFRKSTETSMGKTGKPAPVESCKGVMHCTFDKKGVCRIHKIKGNKSTLKTKKWSKKKFGFGWTTVTSINYTCSLHERVETRPDSGFVEVLRQPNNGNNDSESLECSRSLGDAAD